MHCREVVCRLLTTNWGLAASQSMKKQSARVEWDFAPEPNSPLSNFPTHIPRSGVPLQPGASGHGLPVKTNSYLLLHICQVWMTPLPFSRQTCTEAVVIKKIYTRVYIRTPGSFLPCLLELFRFSFSLRECREKRPILLTHTQIHAQRL